MASSIHLAIAVFRPRHPHQIHRRAAIYIDFIDGRPTWKAQLLWTGPGLHDNPRLQPWTGEAPVLDDSGDFAKYINVGTVLAERDWLLQTLRAVPVQACDLWSSDYRWIEAALRELWLSRRLASEEYEHGVEEMKRMLIGGMV